MKREKGEQTIGEVFRAITSIYYNQKNVICFFPPYIEISFKKRGGNLFFCLICFLFYVFLSLFLLYVGGGRRVCTPL